MPLSPANSHGNGYPLGLTGATAATRYVGGTTSGAPASGTFAVGDYVVTEDGGIQICTVAGSPGTWVAVSGGGGGLYNAWAYLREQQTSTTVSSTSLSAGNFATRVLNTEVSDADGIVTLASNQFTLASGTYLIEGRATQYRTERSKARIRDITNGATVAVGTSCYNDPNVGDAAPVLVTGRIVVSGSTAYELQHFVSAEPDTTNGPGAPTSSGEVEVYGEVQIWRYA